MSPSRHRNRQSALLVGRTPGPGVPSVDDAPVGLLAPREYVTLASHNRHRIRQSALLVGRTPWSAADAPVGLLTSREYAAEPA
jgi:hypothetical protein